MLVQFCNTTVYCAPFSLFLFTVHWLIYTKQLLQSLCSWMWPEHGFSAHIRFFLVWLFSWPFKCGPYQTFVWTDDAPKLTCTHIHLSEAHNHDKCCDRVISKPLEIQPVLIERTYSSVHMDIQLIEQFRVWIAFRLWQKRLVNPDITHLSWGNSLKCDRLWLHVW